jgi:hypothetical protein
MAEGFIPPHGGYQKLLSYQKAEIVFDATVYFCDRFIDRRSRTHDQMVQAARSGKQNIIEGSMASATSKETENSPMLPAPAWKSFWPITGTFCEHENFQSGQRTIPTADVCAS